MAKGIKKGYTITVKSWENDGDHYNTKTMVVQSKEKAKAIKKMCNTIFQSECNIDGGIGNTFDLDSHREMIVEFMKKHPALSDSTDEDTLFNVCMDLNWELMGGSECYSSRVCESVSVTFSEEDVKVKEVKF